MSVTKKIAARLAKTAYVQRALKERQDIRSIRRKPTARFYTGLFLILFSYVIGWPAVAVLGFIAFHLNNPLIAVIGGPVTYGMSHLVFMIGAYLAGAEYVAVVLQWATRVAIEKVLGCPEDAGSQGQLDQHGNSP